MRVVGSLASDTVYLVEEYNASILVSRLVEDHAQDFLTLAHPFADELWTAYF